MEEAAAAPVSAVELSSSPSQEEPEDARHAYISALLYPAVPDVHVSFDLSMNIILPAGNANVIPTVFGQLLGPLAAVAGKLRARQSGVPAPATTRQFAALAGCAGELRPGTLTLLLSAPGHGKTSLLRALAGLFPAAALGGPGVFYNGLSPAQLAEQGVNLRTLAYYVDQDDSHLAFLTVRETLAFAAATATVAPEVMGHQLLVAAAAQRVDRVIRLLHLENAEGTIIGNASVRGVSGGEKKRVSIGEALVTNARLLCLDEISTGLDASVTYDVCASIAAWAHETRGTVVCSLQQPTPEVFSLFDEVLLLREGHTVYHGSREGLPGYVSGLGFRVTGDLADYLIEMLTSPSAVLARQPGGTPPGAPRGTNALVAAWAKEKGAAGEKAAGPPQGLALESPFAKRQYGAANPRSLGEMLYALVMRQFKLSARNRIVLFIRVFASCLNSMILGLVWLKLGTAQEGAKLGMFVFSLAQISFTNYSEIAFVTDSKHVAYKQARMSLYPAWGYTLAQSIVHLPIAAIETACFSIILYFMTDLAVDGGRWAFFYFVCVLMDVAIASLFRLIAYALPTPEAAQSALGPFIALQLVFAGFLIVPARMGTDGWLVWLYYLSTFAYGARSLAHNEFFSKKYNIFLANQTVANALSLTGLGTYIKEPGARAGVYYFAADICAQHPALACGSETFGMQAMRGLGVSPIRAWKWGGVGFLAGWTVLMNLRAALLVTKLAKDDRGRSVGSSYTLDPVDGDEASPSAVAVTAAPAAASSTLPFTAVSVAWRDLSYTVQTPSGEKQLLHGVSGVAAPGRLLSLMGASGAGKTTLLDVIACRKTAGTISGDLYMAGSSVERAAFARNTAYCEQLDVHTALATVSESLHFSAALRLPASVPAATRREFVAEVVELLELQQLSGRLVGEPGTADSLSPSQRKVLTIAVELVSNSPILFLDEPTSGLDSRAAAMVMRVVAKVAATGRTVLTTVHQPSAEIFAMFDDLLLMQRGGWTVYFGPTGPGGAALVSYLEGVPGVHPCPPGFNPASWMLDVLAGTDSSAGPEAAAAAAGGKVKLLHGEALRERLFSSPEWEAQRESFEAACKPESASRPALLTVGYARSLADQIPILLSRTARTYSRSLGYVFQRIKVLTILNTLFATVWYKEQQAVDCAPAQDADRYVCNNTPAGMQSLISIIFINSLFLPVVCMSALIPFMFRQRTIMYREKASYMYAPEAHLVAHVLVEMSWLLFTVVFTLTPLYFCVGFSPNAPSYFFYVFIIWLDVLCFMGMGQWLVALLPNPATAQAATSLVLPLAAIFGGVYLPKTQLPNGATHDPTTSHPHVYWLWLYYIDPVSHSFEALAGSRFADMSRPSNVNHQIIVPYGINCHSASGACPVDALQFLEATRGLSYDRRFRQIGYLLAIAGGMQMAHLYAAKMKTHAVR